jgi:hypothetical protein
MSFNLIILRSVFGEDKMIDEFKSDLDFKNLHHQVTVMSFSCGAENHRMAAWHLSQAIEFHNRAASAFEGDKVEEMKYHTKWAQLHYRHALGYTEMAETIAKNSFV